MNEKISGEKRAAFFDFDGTLTRHDTFLDFHIRRFGRARVAAAFQFAAADALRSFRFSRDSLKEFFVRRMWKDAPRSEYLSDARRYALTRVDCGLIPAAMRVFSRHIELGDDVYIVTASMRDWVAPWAERHGVPVIGTELETADGVLTGRFATPNCRGAEKVRRIRAEADLPRYSKTYAYGNSGGDREMLQMADEAVYKWRREPAGI